MSEVILVTLSTFGAQGRTPVELLERSGHPFRLNTTGARITRDLLAELGADATAVVAGVEPYDAAMLARLPRLRCIARCGVGTDSIDHDAARERGIAILNTPDSPTDAVAELALAMMLALSRDLVRQTGLMHDRRWDRVEARLLRGKRVGILGLGRIGRHVAELLRPFGADLLGTDPLADQAWARMAGVRVVGLEELLSQADILTVHTAGTAGTPLRLGPAELARLPQRAIVLNLARGGVIDEAALLEALRSGRLSGAGLDVYSEEPYRGPLCDLDNVILTPHAATLTVETRLAMETEAVSRLLDHLAARPS